MVLLWNYVLGEFFNIALLHNINQMILWCFFILAIEIILFWGVFTILGLILYVVFGDLLCFGWKQNSIFLYWWKTIFDGSWENYYRCWCSPAGFYDYLILLKQATRWQYQLKNLQYMQFQLSSKMGHWEVGLIKKWKHYNLLYARFSWCREEVFFKALMWVIADWGQLGVFARIERKCGFSFLYFCNIC